MNFKAAVLLTTYNGTEFLSEQIASIQYQQRVECKIFVSDDFSTDNTMDVLLSNVQKNSAIEILDNNQKHLSPAHNFFSLIERVNIEDFDYILYSDQDDVWLPNKINHAIKMIIKNDAHCYASNLFIWIDNSENLKVLKKDQLQTSIDYLFQSASAGCTYCISKSAAIVLKDTITKKLPQSPSIISHDWITYAVTRSHGFKWIIDSSPQIMYRQHENNVYGANSGLSGFLNKTDLIKKGWYKESLQYVSSLCQVNETNQKFITAITRLNILDRLFLFKNFHLLRRKKTEGFLLGLALLIKMV